MLYIIRSNIKRTSIGITIYITSNTPNLSASSISNLIYSARQYRVLTNIHKLTILARVSYNRNLTLMTLQFPSNLSSFTSLYLDCLRNTVFIVTIWNGKQIQSVSTSSQHISQVDITRIIRTETSNVIVSGILNFQFNTIDTILSLCINHMNYNTGLFFILNFQNKISTSLDSHIPNFIILHITIFNIGLIYGISTRFKIYINQTSGTGGVIANQNTIVIHNLKFISADRTTILSTGIHNSEIGNLSIGNIQYNRLVIFNHKALRGCVDYITIRSFGFRNIISTGCKCRNYNLTGGVCCIITNIIAIVFGNTECGTLQRIASISIGLINGQYRFRCMIEIQSCRHIIIDCNSLSHCTGSIPCWNFNFFNQIYTRFQII